MTKPYKPEYPLLCRGLGGVSATLVSGSVTIYDTRLRPYYGDVIEGGTIIDKLPALENNSSAIRIIVNSPLVDLSLKDNEVFRCPKPTETMILGLQGSFQSLAATKYANPSYSGLDTVSLTTYVTIWRGYGARIGKRQGNFIIWEDGQTEEIPSEQDRFKE